ncbi:transposase domain-containing protein, partial [Actinocrinis puniceicyclus]
MPSNPGAARLCDLISLGVLTHWVPPEVVEDAVAEHGRQDKRGGGALPARVMLYYTIAMALFADEDYEGVFDRLAEPLALLGGLDTDYQTPTSGGIAKARARLGEAPVREVFEQV